MLITLIHYFHIKNKKNCISLSNLLFKHNENVFETSCTGQWKVDTLWQCGMWEIMGQANGTSPNTSYHPKNVNMVRMEVSSLCLLQWPKWLYCIKSDSLKAAIDEKHCPKLIK